MEVVRKEKRSVSNEAAVAISFWNGVRDEPDSNIRRD
jgi:hypothetical protein